MRALTEAQHEALVAPHGWAAASEVVEALAARGLVVSKMEAPPVYAYWITPLGQLAARVYEAARRTGVA